MTRAAKLKRPLDLVGLAAALALVGFPARALAYERQVLLAPSVGYGGALSSDAVPAHGLATGLEVSWGWNDAWSIGGHAAYGWARDAASTAHFLLGGLEIFYTLDVLEWVPYLGLGAGVVSRVDGDPVVAPALDAMVGLDYLATRQWLLGVQVRAYVIPYDPGDTVDPVYLTASIRFGWLFDRW